MFANEGTLTTSSRAVLARCREPRPRGSRRGSAAAPSFVLEAMRLRTVVGLGLCALTAISLVVHVVTLGLASACPTHELTQLRLATRTLRDQLRDARMALSSERARAQQLAQQQEQQELRHQERQLQAELDQLKAQHEQHLEPHQVLLPDVDLAIWDGYPQEKMHREGIAMSQFFDIKMAVGNKKRSVRRSVKIFNKIWLGKLFKKLLTELFIIINSIALAKSSINKNSRRGLPVPQTSNFSLFSSFALCILEIKPGIT